MMKKFVKYAAFAFLLFGLIVVFTAYQKLFSAVVKQDKVLYINQQDDFASVKEKLSELGVVQDEVLFDALAQRMNLNNNIYAGKYTLTNGSSILDVIRKLRGNQQDAVKVVLNNINFKQDLAGKIAKQINIDSLAFLNFLNDKNHLDTLGFTKDNIMCLFIPNTYEMYWSPSFTSFIKRMQKEQNSFWTAERKALASKKNLTTDEAFILASIVEKEYKFASERKRIAGVYLNRLNKGMPLQADPTCKFAYGDLSLKRVLKIHTENPHPYNTYYINGLPPGPICLPETSTIDAVLHAETHSFLYFCAHADLDGKHEFNTNLAAHNRAAKKYQRALNKLKIYK